MRRSVFKQRQRLALLAARGGAQRDAEAERCAEVAEREVVLLGEDLRGCHERGLVAGFDGEEHGAQRDERFPAAHIAVEQAVHRTRQGEVGADFLDRAELRAGQRKGQRRVQPAHQRVAAAMHRARLRGLLRALRGDAHLHGEKLAQHEMPPRLIPRLPRIGEMNLPQRPGPRRGVERRRDDGLDLVIAEPFQHLPDQRPKHARRESFGRAMDRHEPLEVDRRLRVVLHDLKLRMRDDRARAAWFRLPVNDQPLAVDDHLLDPVRIEPPAEQWRAERMRGFLLQHHVEHLLVAANPPDAGLFHDPADADRLGGVAGREAVKARAILVTLRKMREQRPDRGQPEALELPLPLRRKPFQISQRRVEMHSHQ